MTEATADQGVRITPHALSRHAKRLRTLMAEHGVTLSTAQSQEAFARVLGMKNWHEAKARCTQALPVILPATRAPSAASRQWGKEVFRAPLPFYPHEPARFRSEDMSSLLIWAQAHDVREIVVQGGDPLFMVTASGIHRVTEHALTPEEVLHVLEGLQGREEQVRHAREGLDDQPLIYTAHIHLPGKLLCRLRVRAVKVWSRDAQTLQMQVSLLSSVPPTYEDLRMPPGLVAALRSNGQHQPGLVVFIGYAGSGCTTSMGAVVRDDLEQHATRKIVTFEDPITYTFDRLTTKGSIAQTELRTGQPFFSRGAREALSRRPTFIMTSDCTDEETLRELTLAAMTGNQVMTNLRGMSVKDGLRRLVHRFPLADRAVGWVDLLTSLRVIVGQRIHQQGMNGEPEPQVEWEYLVMDDATRHTLTHMEPDLVPDWVDARIRTLGNRVFTPTA